MKNESGPSTARTADTTLAALPAGRIPDQDPYAAGSLPATTATWYLHRVDVMDSAGLHLLGHSDTAALVPRSVVCRCWFRSLWWR